MHQQDSNPFGWKQFQPTLSGQDNHPLKGTAHLNDLVLQKKCFRTAEQHEQQENEFKRSFPKR